MHSLGHCLNSEYKNSYLGLFVVKIKIIEGVVFLNLFCFCDQKQPSVGGKILRGFPFFFALIKEKKKKNASSRNHHQDGFSSVHGDTNKDR